VDKIELLLANDRLRRAMGLAARAHAETLTWEAAAAKLLGVFEELKPDAPAMTCLAAAG
jgi:glycosyltransferase involved in cell wall biosynthesis